MRIFLISIVPSAWQDKILGLVRTRLKDAFANADLVCSQGSTALVFPLEATQLANKEIIQSDIVRLMSYEPFKISNDFVKSIAVDTAVYDWPTEKTLADVLHTASNSVSLPNSDILVKVANGRAQSSVGKDNKRAVAKASISTPHSTTENLFGKAAFLMKSEQLN